MLIGKPSEGAFPPELLRQVYRFRHRIFKERLNWQVASRCSLELDAYDELDPVYAAFCRDGSVIGTFRLLPTTGPYMLRDVFSELLRGETLPCASTVWELSRFALEPTHRNARAQLTCSEDTFAMLHACYDFAYSNGIRELVLVISVATERMLRGARIPLVRFGDGRPTQLEGVPSVACRVGITSELGEVLRPRSHERLLEEDRMSIRPSLTSVTHRAGGDLTAVSQSCKFTHCGRDRRGAAERECRNTSP
ncbi:MAG TPA: acyl-homoserine-lactone synthase [Nitrococcus sp.]|nr:acyl-homoserine-lactone synthase [Nitrococcus sp.]